MCLNTGKRSVCEERKSKKTHRCIIRSVVIVVGGICVHVALPANVKFCIVTFYRMVNCVSKTIYEPTFCYSRYHCHWRCSLCSSCCRCFQTTLSPLFLLGLFASFFVFLLPPINSMRLSVISKQRILTLFRSPFPIRDYRIQIRACFATETSAHASSERGCQGKGLLPWVLKQ